jgi:hypothetical protein
MTQDRNRPTRLSYAHEQQDLRADNPLYERAGSVKKAFDAQRAREERERAARRESFMVKRQRPEPELRPPPSLALGSDSAAFDAQWNAERRDAQEFHDRINTERGTQPMDNEQPDPPAERNTPRDVLRDGNLKASIWRNESEKGPFYSAKLARTYTDQAGEPRDAYSFAGNELLRVSELARKAYERTQELRHEFQPTAQPLPDREARREAFQAERGQAVQNSEVQRKAQPAPEPASQHQIQPPTQQQFQQAPMPSAPPEPSREQRQQAFTEQRQQQTVPMPGHIQSR